ncbi:unnamed protein product [Spirodela intermedia]|uniref:Uncharacterized protein n=1 Tax=Spirodela intermedia TaxID=51605 RepID=A0A7I8JAG8_SPIIN|nr:unnamed protein product [Spirodela intermedia]CAA6666991.1 unnamed protein product [Spirodela intermedia]
MGSWWYARQISFSIGKPKKLFSDILGVTQKFVWAEKRRLCGSPAAVTRRRGAGWRRWRLVSRRIVLFPTTACSSINRR